MDKYTPIPIHNYNNNNKEKEIFKRFLKSSIFSQTQINPTKSRYVLIYESTHIHTHRDVFKYKHKLPDI